MLAARLHDDESRARCSMPVTHTLFAEVWEFDTGSSLLQLHTLCSWAEETSTLSVKYFLLINLKPKIIILAKVSVLSLLFFSVTTVKLTLHNVR